MPKKFIHGICIGLVAAIAALSLSHAGWLDWLEGPTWDLRARLLAKPGSATDQIRLIFLDQTSLDWGEQESGWPWPWPREAFAAVANFCKRGGAKAIIFDVLLTEPSREGVEDDERLGSAIAQSINSVTTVILSYDQSTTTNWPPDIAVPKLNVQGLTEYCSGPAKNTLTMPRAAFPIPEIATNSSVIGNVYAIADPDAIIRRMAPFHLFDGQFVPSLGLAAFLAETPDTKLRIENNILHVNQYSIPLDSKGNAVLRFRGLSQTHKTVSADAVIQSEIRLMEGTKPVLQPEFFRNSYVFFGYTAPGLFDLKSTPMSTVYPGVEVHATFLDNLLSNDFLRDTPLPVIILFTLVLSLIAGIAGRVCVTGWQTTLTFLILVPFPLLPGFLAYEQGFWLPVAVQEVAVALALVGAVIINYALEGRQKRFIKGAFKQYLSPAVIDKLLKDPDQLSLGGELRELSILFSDVQGFTSISESLTPEKLTALLNDYLTAMTDIILDEGGTVDKYEGDAIIAFWNAPLDIPDHAIRAVRSALRCNRKLAELRPEFKERAGRDLFARIGINTGPVVVGNMGSNQRFDYTFLGDAGNLASRLEGINKQFGTYIMMSEFTLSQLGVIFAARELSRVKVVGRAQPVKVFEPMFKEDFTACSDIINTFTDALKAYYDGKFEQALKSFLSISEQDPPARAYAQKCRLLIDNPPAGWDGIWEMTEK